MTLIDVTRELRAARSSVSFLENQNAKLRDHLRAAHLSIFWLVMLCLVELATVIFVATRAA